MNRGFIKQIIIIVGALVALKYFLHFDLVDLLSQGKYTEVLSWLKINVWDKFVIHTLWDYLSNFFKNLID